MVIEEVAPDVKIHAGRDTLLQHNDDYNYTFSISDGQQTKLVYESSGWLCGNALGFNVFMIGSDLVDRTTRVWERIGNHIGMKPQMVYHLIS